MEVGLVVERDVTGESRVVVTHVPTGDVLVFTLVAVRKNRVARIGFKADKAKFKILREELVATPEDEQ